MCSLCRLPVAKNHNFGQILNFGGLLYRLPFTDKAQIWCPEADPTSTRMCQISSENVHCVGFQWPKTTILGKFWLIKEEIYVTRGNDLRLQKQRVRYDIRKFGLSNRVINKWNSLPNWVVSANTTNAFKARLDKFWHNQDIVYDFRAQLQGTGSRSEVLCEEF